MPLMRTIMEEPRARVEMRNAEFGMRNEMHGAGGRIHSAFRMPYSEIRTSQPSLTLHATSSFESQAQRRLEHAVPRWFSRDGGGTEGDGQSVGHVRRVG